MSASGFPDLVPLDRAWQPTSIRMVGLPGGSGSDDSDAYLLPLRRIDFRVEVHLSVALVRVTGVFVNSAAAVSDAVLEVPTTQETTMSSASLILADERVVDTMVVDLAETQELKPDAGMLSAIKRYQPQDGTSYNPNVFRLPVSKIPPRSEVSFELSYFENLRFRDGEFVLTVPMRFTPLAMVEGGIGVLDRVLSVAVDVNTGTPEAGKGTRSSAHALAFTRGADAVARTSDGSPLDAGASVPSRFCLALREGAAVPNEDLVISYTARTSRILANALIERMQPAPDGREQGALALFLSPPRLDVVGAVFGRRVLFLLDNSGSMSGRPLALAKTALKACISQLGPADSFGICVFNHRRKWWVGEAAYDKYAQDEGTDPSAPRGHVVHAVTAPALAMAHAFIDTVDVSGMTDILTPVAQAHAVLRVSGPEPQAATVSPGPAIPSYGVAPAAYPGAPPAPSAPAAYPGAPPAPSAPAAYPGAPAREHDELSGAGAVVPIVFLITDGAVAGERGIVRFLSDEQKRAAAAAQAAKAAGRASTPATRVFTFGIGQWCNDHFLRMAAQVGRGHHGSALTVETLREDIESLMERSSAPVLTDLAVGVRGVDAFECFPFPLPDLFCGAPVVVSARYTGPHPSEVLVRGRMPSGEVVTWPVRTFWSAHVPVVKVFARRQLDMLIAKHWLLGGAAPGAGAAEGEAGAGAAGGEEAAALRRRIVALSTEQQVPCPYTAMVGYPTTASDHEARRREEEEDARARKEGRAPPARKGDAEASGAGKDAKAAKSGRRGRYIAGGCAVALGATAVAAVAVGSIAASGAGVGGLVTGAMAGGAEGLGQLGAGALEGLGDAAGAVGQAMGDAAGAAGGFFGDAAGAVGQCDCCGLDLGACGGCDGFLDGCFGDCGTCIGDALRCVPETCFQCGAGVGDCLSGGCDIGGCIGGSLGPCTTCVGSAGDCFSAGCEGVAGLAGNCGALCGGCGEALGSGVGACAEVCGGCGEVLGGCCEIAGALGDCL